MEDRFHSTDQSTESVVSLNQMMSAYPEEEITREKLDSEDESDDSFQSIISDVQEENHLVQNDNMDNQKGRYPERERKKKEFPDYVYEITCIVNEELQSVKEAMENIDKDK